MLAQIQVKTYFTSFFLPLASYPSFLIHDSLHLTFSTSLSLQVLKMGWRESRVPAMMSWCLIFSATTAAPVKAPLCWTRAQVSTQTQMLSCYIHIFLITAKRHKFNLYFYRFVVMFKTCLQLRQSIQVMYVCVEWINTGGEQVDEQTAQEETEDKLKQCIDNLMDKRWGQVRVIKTRKRQNGSRYKKMVQW